MPHDDVSAPHPVDRHVGRRVAMRRVALGHSQKALAESLGLTFQQIQKYERGSNRISASKLWEIAAFLGVTVDTFFEGLPGDETPPQTTEAPITRSGLALASSVTALTSRQQRLVLDLAREMAGVSASPDDEDAADREM